MFHGNAPVFINLQGNPDVFFDALVTDRLPGYPMTPSVSACRAAVSSTASSTRAQPQQSPLMALLEYSS